MRVENIEDVEMSQDQMTEEEVYKGIRFSKSPKKRMRNKEGTGDMEMGQEGGVEEDVEAIEENVEDEEEN